MKLKKIKIIAIIATFAFTVLFHFLYDWFPNPLFSVLFPVNESIWEHMKLLYSGLLAWSIIEYFILKKLNIKFTNYWSSIFLTMISSIIVYLIIFLPLYAIFGENPFISIGLLILVIIASQIFNYYLITRKKENTLLNKIAIALIIIGYVVFLSLTYNPPKNYIFYDTVDNKYGIDIYEIE